MQLCNLPGLCMEVWWAYHPDGRLACLCLPSKQAAVQPLPYFMQTPQRGQNKLLEQ